MWCDNCLLIFPLRHGAMALAAFVALYNIAGSIVLFKYGQYLFFVYPDYQLYGGIGMGAAVMCVLTCVALSNWSHMWTRLTFFLWPAILLLVAVRAGFMIFFLNYRQDRIIWECNHGGQQWTQDAYNASKDADLTGALSTDSGSARIPTGFCSAGFHSTYLAFTFSLIIDLILQIYVYFMDWRFLNRLIKYMSFKYQNGVYAAA